MQTDADAPSFLLDFIICNIWVCVCVYVVKGADAHF